MGKYFGKSTCWRSLLYTLKDIYPALSFDEDIRGDIENLAKRNAFMVVSNIDSQNPFKQFPYLSQLYTENEAAARRVIYNHYNVTSSFSQAILNSVSSYVHLMEIMKSSFESFFGADKLNTVPEIFKKQMKDTYISEIYIIVYEWCKNVYVECFWKEMRKELEKYIEKKE